MKKILLILPLLSSLGGFAQREDSLVVRKIFDYMLTESKAYQNLEQLCREAPARISGSKNAEKAVELTFNMLKEAGADTVWLQEVMVPHWERGNIESAEIISGKENTPLKICALGGSVPTPEKGITAEVIEVNGLEELEKIGEAHIKGKIVFFNKPMPANEIEPFRAYEQAIGQRVWGADKASEYGALAVIVRSMSLRTEDAPHTGVMVYKSGKKIPGVAISTRDADMLSEKLKQESKLKIKLQLNCKTLPDVLSYNVIGEIRGNKTPEEIILVGGHLDSWDLSEGAHDNGAGVVQSIEVIRAFKQLRMRPERTIRCVLFMNEENGGKGGRTYADEAKKKNEKHILAIESDRGGFSPRGFNVEGDSGVYEGALHQLRRFTRFVLGAYNIHHIMPGESGVDISKLKDQKTVLMVLIPDPQRYFDVHHSSEDKFIHVNKRELELGAGAITSVVYFFSKNGIGPHPGAIPMRNIQNPGGVRRKP